ncbi:hypothetical protein B0T16DRAFT_314503 [Cercophora newfieldiana]|uniref:Betaine lipid synthase n=1 Tax=Cercophora newfieldiana TaxID=92897 RepID=A0AA39YT12_9PEZI|nr:hypothetical protein B0T16DRAFT_314503 [Cercophora newfieldiana]
MDSLGGNISPPGIDTKLLFTGISGVALFTLALFQLSPRQRHGKGEDQGLLRSLMLFCYSCFLKPHPVEAKATQQDALESFYSSQASIYDSTRKTLLKGREDMLALAAAQLQLKAERAGGRSATKRIWVDFGGGTGWNIETMSKFVNVPKFFSTVYLVDLSPSLCEVARRRFDRLGWTNVKVVCQDARTFQLKGSGADLITMSYSLSMIPDYYSVVDSLIPLLSPRGIIGVIDFYVQSKIDVSFRNYTGGLINRHVNFFSRTFWRAWFDLDRVALEPSRRDYLEYRFGTVLMVSSRNYTLGSIPYYVWLGCHRGGFPEVAHDGGTGCHIDGLGTETPWNAAKGDLDALTGPLSSRAWSKAFEVAAQNISASLPLPSFFYQNHRWRMYYDDQLKKHTQFNDEYIYAFTWEDSRVDGHLLRLGPEDVVLAITSAGDNILAYAMQSPAKIHAVDLNPTQNHLLELKLACFTALPYEDIWRIFGEGKHPQFRSLLVSRLSPHLSSRAFQYWLNNADIFRSRGLYDTGGSRHAIRVFRWISHLFGCRRDVKRLLTAKTLNEQAEIWQSKIRPALASRIVSSLVISSETFLWSALGVPKNQLAMIEQDHANSEAVNGSTPTAKNTRAHAVWHYMVDTLDPVLRETHIATDNPYYHVCLEGSFSTRCHPEYLSKSGHALLSRPGAFDGLRIHTDEIEEIVSRMEPASLTVAVVMDSMDWFDPSCAAATQQITKLNQALKLGGRVLLRSSALTPWYIREFEANGFAAKRVGNRTKGNCIDRVNMYASCWICTKKENTSPQREV